MRISSVFFEKSTQFSNKVEQLITSLDKNLTSINISSFISTENTHFITNLNMANLALNNTDYLVFLNLAKTHVSIVKSYSDFLLENKLSYDLNLVKLSNEALEISDSIQKLILETEN